MGAQEGIMETGEGTLTPRYLAAALSFAAQLIHVWVLPAHYLMWNTAGYFLLFVAGCQGVLGVSLLFGAGRRTLRMGILLNLFVVFVWVFTRTVGIPAWVAFMREPVGALDLSATAAEVALVALLVKLWRGPRRSRTTRSRFMYD